MTIRAGAAEVFNLKCRACTRLASFLDEVRAAHPGYHARPVAPFGDPAARLLVVGLAVGCLNAWHWITKEDKAMHDETEDDNE